MTREPYAATPAGVIWKRTLLTDESQPAGDAAAYELQFPATPSGRAIGEEPVEQVWSQLANLDVPEGAPFRVAPVAIRDGQTPCLQVPAGVVRQITEPEMTRWIPDLIAALTRAGLGLEQIESAALVEHPRRPPVLLLSPVPFNIQGWGLLPVELSEPSALEHEVDAQVSVATTPLPTLTGQIRGLIRRHTINERRSAPRRGAMILTTLVTGLLLAAMFAVQQTSLSAGEPGQVPLTQSRGEEPSVACPSLQETADLARNLLEKRGAALAENQLGPLIQAESWELVLLDMVEVARRKQDQVVVEPPAYLVEVNSQRCADGRVLALTTVAAVLDSERVLPAVLLELELQVSPPRILAVGEGPTRS